MGSFEEEGNVLFSEEVERSEINSDAAVAEQELPGS